MTMAAPSPLTDTLAALPGTEDAVSRRLIDNMLNGEAPSAMDEPYAAAIAMIFALSAPKGKARLALRAKVPSDPARRKRLIDVVMTKSYSAEDFKISLARVAKAVAVIGFGTLTAFTATCAYNIFPELQCKELKDGRGSKNKRRN